MKIQIQFLEDDKEDTESLLKGSKKENIDLNSKFCQLLNQSSKNDKYIKNITTKHHTEMLDLQRIINVKKLKLTTETEQRKSIEGQLRHAQSEVDKLVTDRKHDTLTFKQVLSTMKEKVVILEKNCKQKDEDLNEARNTERLLKLQLENIGEDYKR